MMIKVVKKGNEKSEQKGFFLQVEQSHRVS